MSDYGWHGWPLLLMPLGLGVIALTWWLDHRHPATQEKPCPTRSPDRATPSSSSRKP